MMFALDVRASDCAIAKAVCPHMLMHQLCSYCSMIEILLM